MDQSPPHSSSTSFPILAISILGILTTAILLLSYYIFVIKCCLNWRRSDLLLLRFSHSRRLRPQVNRRATQKPCGLDPSTINSIPTFRFVAATNSTAECAVCLTDFQEKELLRLLPNCKHLFHIDCIDVWLQSNPNCPLCRVGISLLPVLQFCGSTSNTTLTEEDSSVVVEVREPRRFGHVKSKGDEYIDAREKDERFVVQPIRRSFSMDSSNDRGLYASVQEILKQNANFVAEGSSTSNGSSGGGRIRRSLFSFGRSSRSASVLPVQSEFQVTWDRRFASRKIDLEAANPSLV